MKKRQKRILQVFIIIVLLLLLFIIVKYFGRIDSVGEGGDTSKIDVFDIVVLGEEAGEKEEVVNIIKERSNRINEEPIRNSLENIIEESEGNEVVITNTIVPENTINNNTVDTNTVEGTLIVHDEEVEYGNITRVNIFKNANKNTIKDKIAPEDSGTYKFYVRNNNNFGIIYEIHFAEVNQDNVNLKYRLKKNGEYIVSDWATSADILVRNIELNSKKYDSYELEWKWFEASNDTEIGEKEESKYELDLFFYAVEKD